MFKKPFYRQLKKLLPAEMTERLPNYDAYSLYAQGHDLLIYRNWWMPWQLNSTVLYALGIESGGEDNLTYDDLEIDSGYNTYKYAGYPIGPICNPGYSSLQAVLYPADTDAIYFVLKKDGSGSHFFTDDYDEFLAAADGNYSESDEEYTEDEY